MFISQTAPLNTRNRILNPHQDDSPPIFSAIIVFLVTTGFNTKTKTCYLKIMLSSASDHSTVLCSVLKIVHHQF